jgi:hypothetical protein
LVEVYSRGVFSRIRETLKGWTLRSRKKRAGNIAHDAGERAKELDDRGKTGGFRYVLNSPDGEDLGEFVTAVPDWRIGEAFHTRDGRRFRILEIVPFLEEDTVYSAMWKVLALDDPEDYAKSNGR